MITASSVRLKVCGMRDPANIRQVAALSPDYMGFIFYAPSKRAVGPDFYVPPDLPDSVKRVGVFVNESLAGILAQVRKHSLQFVQLHGEETVDLCAQLKASGIGVIKVLRANDSVEFDVLKPYRTVVDYFLFDSRGSVYGGTGSTFNWALLKKYDQEVPFFLSGGLSPENISDISSLAGMNIHALDVNSGVEIKPAIKDVERIKKVQSRIALLDLEKHS